MTVAVKAGRQHSSAAGAAVVASGRDVDFIPGCEGDGDER